MEAGIGGADEEYDMEEEETPELTTDQLKLLYMISRWSRNHLSSLYTLGSALP